jgi:hypothetical protein
MVPWKGEFTSSEKVETTLTCLLSENVFFILALNQSSTVRDNIPILNILEMEIMKEYMSASSKEG